MASSPAILMNPQYVHGRIFDIYEEARQTHGNLGVPFEGYARRVMAICAKVYRLGEPSLALVPQLHYCDLYLAMACAAGIDEAWERFDKLYRKYLTSLFFGLCWQTSVAADLSEGMLAELFLPDGSGKSKIATYDGRSSLQTWLRTISSNRVYSEMTRRNNVDRRPEAGDKLQGSSINDHPDDAVARKRYEKVLKESVRIACAELDADEKTLLIWRFDQGVRLGRIAEILEVHQSTITRSIERIGRKMRSSLAFHLVRAGVGPAAIEECVALLVGSSSHDISFLDMLKESLAGNHTDSRPHVVAIHDGWSQSSYGSGKNRVGCALAS